MAVDAFTVLAVLEAQDKVSSVVERVTDVLDQYTDTVTRAAETSQAAGDAIDQSLLQTASGADAVQLADARLSAAQAQLTAATDQQAAAERDLLAAQQAAADAGEADAAVIEQQIAAAGALADAQAQAAKATAAVADAEKVQADTARAAAAANGEAAAVTDEAAASQAALGTEADKSSGLISGAGKAMTVAAIAAAAIGAVTVKAASNFQSSTEHLVTDAGESQKSLAMVQQGILNVAAATGTSTSSLVDGAYHIESAGFHGAQALQLLQTAAEGAKVGGADLDTVSKALTGSMNAYNLTGAQSVSMMNQLIATVGAGDMRMEDLASSMSSVTAVAASAHISFAQVGGAIATMTAQGMSAAQATQDLGHTIGALSNPNQTQIKEMQAMGVDSNDLSSKLGQRGLTGTLQVLTQAIAAHTQGGQVLISTFNSSQQAAADANTMIKAMPASLQALANSYLAGTTSQQQWTTDLKGLPPIQAAAMKQFATLADKTHAFNSELASGSPAAQTYNAAMSKMMGGTVGLNTALMLTGDHAATFATNVQTVADAADKGGSSVDNWSAIQSTLSQKLDEAKVSVEALGIKIGMVLLPIVSKVAGAVAEAAGWFAKHAASAEILAGVIGGVLVAAVTALGVAMVSAFGWLELIAVGIAAVVAGVVYAYEHFKTFRTVIDDVGKFLGTTFKAAWQAAGAVIDWFRADVLPAVEAAIGDVFAWFEAHKADFEAAWDDLVHDIEAIIHWFDANVLQWIEARVSELVTWWQQHSAEITQIWDAAWTEIGAIVGIIWGGVIKPLLQTLAGFWSLIWGIIVDALKLAWTVISDVVTTAMHLVENIIAVVLDVVTGHWGQAWSDLKKLVSDAFSDILTFIGDTVSGFGTLLWDAGANLIKGLINGVKSQISGITSTISSVAKSIADFFPHSPAKTGPLSGTGGMDYAGANVGKQLASGMHSAVGVVAAASGALAGAASLSVGGHYGALTAGGLGGLAYTAGSVASGSTTIIDLRGSSVMGNSAMDQLVNKIGNRLATSTLPQGGVRIRM